MTFHQGARKSLEILIYAFLSLQVISYKELMIKLSLNFFCFFSVLFCPQGCIGNVQMLEQAMLSAGTQKCL